MKKLSEILNLLFNDLAIFMISVSILLIIILHFNLELSEVDFSLDRTSGSRSIHLLYAIPIFIYGIYLSLLPIFGKKVKKDYEKKTILIYALLIEISSVFITAGYIQQNNFCGFYYIFPFWNLLSILILIYIYESRNEFFNQPFNLPEVLIAFFSIILFIVILKSTTKFYWALIVSISLMFSSILSVLICYTKGNIHDNSKPTKFSSGL